MSGLLIGCISLFERKSEETLKQNLLEMIVSYRQPSYPNMKPTSALEKWAFEDKSTNA